MGKALKLQTTGGVLGRNGCTAISSSTIPIMSARKMSAGGGKGSSAVAILQFQGQLTHGSHFSTWRRRRSTFQTLTTKNIKFNSHRIEATLSGLNVTVCSGQCGSLSLPAFFPLISGRWVPCHQHFTTLWLRKRHTCKNPFLKSSFTNPLKATPKTATPTPETGALWRTCSANQQP